MFKLKIAHDHDVTIWHCAGQMVRGLDNKLFVETILSEKNRRIELDLEQVDAVDAAGLGSLVFLHTWARSQGAEVKFVNPSPRLREMLRLTNLDSVLDIRSAERVPCQHMQVAQACCC